MHYLQRMISFKTNKDVIIYVPANYIIIYLCTDYLLKGKRYSTLHSQEVN